MTELSGICLAVMVSCNVILTAVMTSRIIDRLKDLERRLNGTNDHGGDRKGYGDPGAGLEGDGSEG